MDLFKHIFFLRCDKIYDGILITTVNNLIGEAQDNVPVKQKKVSDPTAQLKEKPLAGM